MSQLEKIEQTPRGELVKILRDSVWPGAKDESIEMAIAYCRVNGLDPFLKPVHIVPLYDKSINQMRDVLMPGIADYRIKAARSGEYAGKSEPQFGEDITTKLSGVQITYPQWCKITIERIVAGKPRQYVAKEYWLENYATAKRDTDAPNSMWKKRPYGQLSKCAEAQALRMAFPEFSGGMVTAEEMEGKSFEGTTLEADHKPLPPQRITDETVVKNAIDQQQKSTPPSQKTLDTVQRLISEISIVTTFDEFSATAKRTEPWRAKLNKIHPDLSKQVDDAYDVVSLKLRNQVSDNIYPLFNQFGEEDDGPFGAETDAVSFAKNFKDAYNKTSQDQRAALLEINADSINRACAADGSANEILFHLSGDQS
jgi:phage recombination protein Bet